MSTVSRKMRARLSRALSDGTRPPRECFERSILSGNPPSAPYVHGWIVRLGGPATIAERAWLVAHGYKYGGGKWVRADRRIG